MHVAAQPEVPASVKDPINDASVNVMGLLNVLECCATIGVRKVVYAASGGTLYGEPRKLPVKESAAAAGRPVSPYGISKKVALEYLTFYERYRGIAHTALALANVYGPRQDPGGEAGVVSIFATKMLAGEAPTIFGDGNQTRDYVFVDDAVHAFALAAERGDGRLLNVGTGVETSVNGLYRMLAEITGFSGQPQAGPARSGDLRRSVLDPSLAAEVLGWRPWTHLEDGLGETVAFLKGV
jgi:UDP-glucose 4-epimerase